MRRGRANVGIFRYCQNSAEWFWSLLLRYHCKVKVCFQSLTLLYFIAAVTLCKPCLVDIAIYSENTVSVSYRFFKMRHRPTSLLHCCALRRYVRDANRNGNYCSRATLVTTNSAIWIYNAVAVFHGRIPRMTICRRPVPFYVSASP